MYRVRRDDLLTAIGFANTHDALVAALRETLAVVESRWGADPTCANAAAWREARLAEWRAALKLADVVSGPLGATEEGQG